MSVCGCLSCKVVHSQGKDNRGVVAALVLVTQASEDVELTIRIAWTWERLKIYGEKKE